MALSRIWAAFIIVAIVAAGLQCLLSPAQGDIFNRMVVGKAGDTARTIVVDSLTLQPQVLKAFDTVKEIKSGEIKFVKGVDNKIISFREQSADGIIATCKTAVDISINLIGIMALFMGFMSIAERAGGVRLTGR